MLKPSDPKAIFATLRAGFEDQMTQRGFNSLVYGDMGTGKTFSLRTARKPVLLFSFDPNGHIGLRDEVKKGEVIVLPFENEDPGNPTQFRLWADWFDTHRSTDLFKSVGTVALDSLTTWTDALMGSIIKKAGRQGQNPQLQDYGSQLRIVRDYVKLLAGLPCDFVALAHIKYDKDEESGKLYAGPMLAGQLSALVPTIFDEVYVSTAKEGPKAPEYRWQTQTVGPLKARSRLAGKGLIDLYEPQDFKAILKKAGMPVEDKALLLP